MLQYRGNGVCRFALTPRGEGYLGGDVMHHLTG